MAGPFTQFPTLGEFEWRAINDFGCWPGEEIGLEGPFGPTIVRYLVREAESGEIRFALLPDLPDTARLGPSKLRGLCAQLEIDHTVFGLPEDYPEIPDD